MPNSNAFEVQGIDEWLDALKIRTKNPAVGGKANHEILKEFQKIFDSKIEIVSGKKSSIKQILIKEKSPEQVSKALGLQQ